MCVAIFQVDLINLVSIALLRSPDLENANDETRKQLMKQVKEMAKIDPEFILKVGDSVSKITTAYLGYMGLFSMLLDFHLQNIATGPMI